jgi:hypothetical protein
MEPIYRYEDSKLYIIVKAESNIYWSSVPDYIEFCVSKEEILNDIRLCDLLKETGYLYAEQTCIEYKLLYHDPEDDTSLIKFQPEYFLGVSRKILHNDYKSMIIVGIRHSQDEIWTDGHNVKDFLYQIEEFEKENKIIIDEF